MVHIGDKSFGFFYTKNKKTFVEMDGSREVKAPSEMAETATKNVVLLLDKDGSVLDIDDLPTPEAMERSVGGETFVSFVEHEGAHVFVVNGEVCLNLEEKEGEWFLEIFSDDFKLEACLADNHFETKDLESLEEKEFLVIFTEKEPFLSREEKLVRLSSAEILIEEIDC